MMRYAPRHESFIQDTNCVVMKRHGITVLGRTVSECYHRVNVYPAEVKRQIEMRRMFALGDSVVYPALVRKDAT